MNALVMWLLAGLLLIFQVIVLRYFRTQVRHLKRRLAEQERKTNQAKERLKRLEEKRAKGAEELRTLRQRVEEMENGKGAAPNLLALATAEIGDSVALVRARLLRGLEDLDGRWREGSAEDGGNSQTPSSLRLYESLVRAGGLHRFLVLCDWKEAGVAKELAPQFRQILMNLPRENPEAAQWDELSKLEKTRLHGGIEGSGDLPSLRDVLGEVTKPGLFLVGAGKGEIEEGAWRDQVLAVLQTILEENPRSHVVVFRPEAGEVEPVLETLHEAVEDWLAERNANIRMDRLQREVIVYLA